MFSITIITDIICISTVIVNTDIIIIIIIIMIIVLVRVLGWLTESACARPLAIES